MFNFNSVSHSICLNRYRALPLILTSAISLAAVPVYALQQGEIEVYPPNWWAGMQNPEVELMIYGEDVADDAVSLATGNVKLAELRHLIVKTIFS